MTKGKAGRTRTNKPALRGLSAAQRRRALQGNKETLAKGLLAVDEVVLVPQGRFRVEGRVVDSYSGVDGARVTVRVPADPGTSDTVNMFTLRASDVTKS